MALESAGSKPVVDLTERIHSIRGVRVMLDSDLAAIYGVTAKRPNEQVKRNPKRFPADFVFQVAPKELTRLRSQNATSKNLGRGGRRYAPLAFTEHGAIMAANVLRSERAAEMSVFVVRAFVRMREVIAGNAALQSKLNELERKVSSHDESIAEIVSAIRELINPTESADPKREIGFHVKNRQNLKIN
jgi:hypothetical protein